MIDHSEITVVVLTRYWPTALGVIRSLGSAGFCVDMVASASKKGATDIAASSKYLHNHTETVCPNVKEGDDPGLLDALLKYDDLSKSGPRPVLFPTDDYTVSFMDRYRDKLSGIFIMPYAGNGSPGCIVRLMDKEVQSQLAVDAGLSCPKSWIIDLSSDNIPEDMVYPCFCKPLDSSTGFKGEMARCNDPDDLTAHLAFLRERNPERRFLIQEFLDISEEIVMGGVCVGNNESGTDVIIPGIIRKTNVAIREKGVTMSGVMRPVDELNEKVLDGIITMLKNTGYHGMFDLELNITGDRIWFGELNLRSGGPSFSYQQSGANLPALVVSDLAAAGINREFGIIDRYGISFVNEFVLWKEYLKGFLSRDRLKSILDSSDCGLIESNDDTIPSDLFRKETAEKVRNLRKKQFKKKLRRLTGPVRRFVKGLRKGV